ncbi:MAG: low affinity iron permease family protein [Terriglobales bacterium]
MENQKDSAFHEFFVKTAASAAAWVGAPWSFVLALLIVVVWGISGPRFHYSDTWQLVINTGTTIVTFLMVFLIQNTQNRDARAIHLKLDELIRSFHDAHNDLIHVEKLPDAELEVLAKRYERIRAEYDARTKRAA